MRNGDKIEKLLELQKVAKNRGGKLLSDRYITAKTKLRWRCSEGHEWDAIPDSVKRGTWCPICRRGSLPILSLSVLQEAAKRYGGWCLATVYVNIDTKVRWRCSEGHEWQAKADHVLRGHWCPYCSTGISERICRALIEHITDESFPKSRPKWLLNDRGNSMELDGYAESIRVAFEYQGQQHYHNVKHFHREPGQLQHRQQDDERKRQLCKQNNVYLVEIPYFIPHDEINIYLITTLRSLPNGDSIVKNTQIVDIDSLNVRSEKRLQEMRAIAKARGGECLSDFYINNNTKLRWKCGEGHEWKAVPSSVKGGTWCPKCGDAAAGKKKSHSIELMHRLAAERGGECLSSNYKNSKSRLRFRCSEGHEWETQASVVIAGHWCDRCEKMRLGRKYALTIEEMREIAKQKNGKCLSEEYINNRIKLQWECELGHRWWAVSNSVKRGSWCPICAGRKPKNFNNGDS